MARRARRDRLTAAASPDRSRTVVLRVHLGLVGLLLLATVVLFGVPTGNSDCCLPVAAVGLFTLVELIVVLGAMAIAVAVGRFGALAVVDTLITAPVVYLVPSMFIGSDATTAAIPFVALGLLIVGLAGAALAARQVRGTRVERILVASAVIAIALVALPTPAAAVVPLIVLAVLLWPRLEEPGEPPSGQPPPAPEPNTPTAPDDHAT